MTFLNIYLQISHSKNVSKKLTPQNGKVATKKIETEKEKKRTHFEIRKDWEMHLQVPHMKYDCDVLVIYFGMRYFEIS